MPHKSNKKKKKTVKHSSHTKPRQTITRNQLKETNLRSRFNRNIRKPQITFFRSRERRMKEIEPLNQIEIVEQQPITPNILDQMLAEFDLTNTVIRNEDQLVYIEGKYHQLYTMKKESSGYRYNQDLCCDEEDRENIYKITRLIQHIPEYMHLDIAILYGVLVQCYYSLKYNEPRFSWLKNNFMEKNLRKHFRVHIRDLAKDLFNSITTGDIQLGRYNLSSVIRRIIMEMGGG